MLQRQLCGLTTFELYILGKSYDVVDLANSQEKAVINDFDTFCEQHLSEVMVKVPDSPALIATLAKQWKAPAEQEAQKLHSENASLHSRLAPFEKKEADSKEADEWRITSVEACVMVSRLFP
jgi:hypothetical protein